MPKKKKRSGTLKHSSISSSMHQGDGSCTAKLLSKKHKTMTMEDEHIHQCSSWMPFHGPRADHQVGEKTYTPRMNLAIIEIANGISESTTLK